jgi:hypothetical protein
MEVWYLFVVEIGFPHAHAPNARSVHYQYFGPVKVTLDVYIAGQECAHI